MFLDWTRNKILELRQQYPNDDAKVMEGVRQFFGSSENPQEDSAKAWQRVIEAAGGTSEGMLKLLREREQIYEQTAPMFSVPYDEYQKQVKVFMEDLEKSGNPFLKESVPAFIKSRQREFRIQAMLAMVHAAIEYKLHGESGLKSVTDPCGKGPFAFRRFVFEGVDRGFELRSEYSVDKNIAVLIFVEKEGPPFQVDGNYPGRPIQKAAPQQ